MHAGALQQTGRDQLLRAPRRLPIVIFHGGRDTIVPIPSDREARDVLTAQGFPVEINEMPAHDHNYDTQANTIDREAWSFLKDAVLFNRVRSVP